MELNIRNMNTVHDSSKRNFSTTDVGKVSEREDEDFFALTLRHFRDNTGISSGLFLFILGEKREEANDQGHFH